MWKRTAPVFLLATPKFMSVFRFGSTAIYCGLAVLWTVGMIVAFSIPPTTLPRVQPVLSIDKLVHFALFLGFGVLWMRVLCVPSTARLPDRLWTYGLRFGGGGVCFAVGTELYQQVLPIRRVADPYDALANGAGLVAGIVLYAGYAQWARPETTIGDES